MAASTPESVNFSLMRLGFETEFFCLDEPESWAMPVSQWKMRMVSHGHDAHAVSQGRRKLSDFVA